MKGPFMEDNIHHASTSGLAMNRKTDLAHLCREVFPVGPPGKKKTETEATLSTEGQR